MSRTTDITGALHVIGHRLDVIQTRMTEGAVVSAAERGVADLAEQLGAVVNVLAALDAHYSSADPRLGGARIPHRMFILPEHLGEASGGDIRTPAGFTPPVGCQSIPLTWRERMFATSAIRFVGDNLPEDPEEVLEVVLHPDEIEALLAKIEPAEFRPKKGKED